MRESTEERSIVALEESFEIVSRMKNGGLKADLVFEKMLLTKNF